jgi:hypothetical protein
LNEGEKNSTDASTKLAQTLKLSDDEFIAAIIKVLQWVS